MTTLKKIGILHGRERTFPEAFIESINSRKIAGIMAEEVSLGGTSYNEPKQYAVIVDRISHEIKYYRNYLKLAALNGTRVINNPFWWSADDKFFGTALVARLGVAVPKTILLPNRSYPDGVVQESLHNLKFPLDWEGMLAYVGLPAIIKPAEGGGGKSVSKIHDLQELWNAFDKSGDTQMMLQECIEWEHYVRCLCVGQEKILPIKWHPPFGRMFGEYFVDHNHLTPELGVRVVKDALAINRALGYDMNTVEFAIRDGIPYAIDFTNPAPDFDRNSITDHYFYQIVEWMTELAIAKAQEPGVPQVNLKWWSMIGWNDPAAHKGSNGNGRHAESKETHRNDEMRTRGSDQSKVAVSASHATQTRPVTAPVTRPTASLPSKAATRPDVPSPRSASGTATRTTAPKPAAVAQPAVKKPATSSTKGSAKKKNTGK